MVRIGQRPASPVKPSQVDRTTRASTTVSPFSCTMTGFKSISSISPCLAARSESSIGSRTLADADLQTAATAILHGLEIVTGNLRHLTRILEIRFARLSRTRAGTPSDSEDIADQAPRPPGKLTVSWTCYENAVAEGRNLLKRQSPHFHPRGRTEDHEH